MAAVRTFELPHYEQYPVHVALFTDVKNAGFLRSQLLAGNPDFDYAFLDAEMLLSPTHLLTATFLALHAHLTSRPKTRTPHSELVFRLSPTTNIAESYKNFGLGDSTTRLVAVKLPLHDGSVTRESVGRHLGSVVEGRGVEIGEMGGEVGAWCDVGRVRRAYKLGNGGKGGEGNGRGGEDERRELESVILGLMALKGS